jgi:hypothetical protein
MALKSSNSSVRAWAAGELANPSKPQTDDDRKAGDGSGSGEGTPAPTKKRFKGFVGAKGFGGAQSKSGSAEMDEGSIPSTETPARNVPPAMRGLAPNQPKKNGLSAMAAPKALAALRPGHGKKGMLKRPSGLATFSTMLRSSMIKILAGASWPPSITPITVPRTSPRRSLDW